KRIGNAVLSVEQRHDFESASRPGCVCKQLESERLDGKRLSVLALDVDSRGAEDRAGCHGLGFHSFRPRHSNGTSNGIRQSDAAGEQFVARNGKRIAFTAESVRSGAGSYDVGRL